MLNVAKSLPEDPDELRQFTALLLAAVFGCSTTHRAMDPSNRSEYLTEKVKNTRNAYLRFAQAEEDSRKENNPKRLKAIAKPKSRPDKTMSASHRSYPSMKQSA